MRDGWDAQLLAFWQAGGSHPVACDSTVEVGLLQDGVGGWLGASGGGGPRLLGLHACLGLMPLFIKQSLQAGPFGLAGHLTQDVLALLLPQLSPHTSNVRNLSSRSGEPEPRLPASLQLQAGLDPCGNCSVPMDTACWSPVSIAILFLACFQAVGLFVGIGHWWTCDLAPAKSQQPVHCPAA